MNKNEMQSRIDALQAEMNQPNFWVDKIQAQKKVDEYNKLKQQLENWADRPNYLTGKYDASNAYLTLSAGTGGTEAADWAEMLLRMYLRYGEKKGWKTEILEKNAAEEAGIKNATLKIEGVFVYGYLKVENGVHRLVRISPFDADKARHTSFALVEVLPEIEDNEIEIKDQDIKIDTYRSSGHGGQSVNTTDSAIRITHLPTGIVVTCQNERSQLQNKEIAIKILKARLIKMMEKERVAKIEELKSSIVGAQWGSQIRNYVLHPYTMVKDTRSNWSSSNAQSILNGDLDNVIISVLKLGQS